MQPRPTPASSSKKKASAPAPRKNVMLVSFDDAIAFWHYKRAFGVKLYTPNLDRICAQSTAFKSAYCQAPVCGPSRASFMSGLTPHQSGVFENRVSIFDRVEPREMWPYLLRQSGYYCSSGGKVHHSFKPLPKPLHEQFYDDERKHFRIDWNLPEDKPQVALGGHRKGLATTDPADDDYYHDAHSTSSAIRFLEDYSGEAPFYREVGLYSPHGPYITPLRFKEHYHVNKIKQPEAWRNGFPQNDYANKIIKTDPIDAVPGYWAKSVRNYISALSHADYQIGRLWRALKASPHADNTVLIIVSDHGFHLGERSRFRKTSLWEQVANVPLIVHDPDTPEARVVHDPVPLLDVGPTVFDYAGLPPLKGRVGRSLRHYINGGKDLGRAVPTFYFDNVSLRKGKYRLIRYVDGSTEFYDLENDWWQTKDLGEDHPDFAKTMQALGEASAEYGLDITKARPRPMEPRSKKLAADPNAETVYV